MIRVNRAQLLRSLQTVQPGLSPKDIIEQSSCFVFKDGQVMTYNDEIACRTKTPLSKKFVGAVQAAPLLAILGKLSEDDIEIQSEGAELIVIGKKRRAGIRMEAEISLPIESAEAPGDNWNSLHEDFVEAVNIVQDCAGKDESQFVFTCIHIHPKWIEACDNFQMTRYKLLTGVKEKCLIRKDSLRHIVALEMHEFNETETWIHFRNSLGLTLSCRRYLEDYKDLRPLMDFKGESIQLPKGLGEAADKAEIFSSETTDENQVWVYLKPGKLRIKGVGNSGWYAEIKKLKYNGPALSFQIAPSLLKELTRKHNECEITSERLKVDGGKWVYVTSLGDPKAENGKEGS